MTAKFSLLIETSTERGCVAILNEMEKLFHEELPTGYLNSKYLIPTIEKGIKQTGISFKDLSFITAGVGPGSYTGIRVGATVAKAISYGHKIPLIGVSTLTGFVPDEEGSFAALIDAKIGGVYLMLGQKMRGIVNFLSEPLIIPIDKLLPHLLAVERIATPFMPVIKSKIEKHYPDMSWIWEEKSPSPLCMTFVALKLYKEKNFSLDTSLDLLYMRKTQAEIEKEQRKG